MKKKDEIDLEYEEFINKVAEAEIYSKKYYLKNREKMRKYQRKYLREIRMGIRKPKRRNPTSKDYIMTYTKKNIVITFD